MPDAAVIRFYQDNLPAIVTRRCSVPTMALTLPNRVLVGAVFGAANMA